MHADALISHTGNYGKPAFRTYTEVIAKSKEMLYEYMLKLLKH